MSLFGYESLLNEQVLDLSTLVVVGVNDGPVHVEDEKFITRPIENKDVLDNTLTLTKFNTNIFSSSNLGSTLAYRDATGSFSMQGLTAVTTKITGQSTLQNVTADIVSCSTLNVSSAASLFNFTCSNIGSMANAIVTNFTVPNYASISSANIVNIVANTISASSINIETSLGVKNLTVSDTTSTNNLTVSNLTTLGGNLLPRLDSTIDIGSNLNRPSNVYGHSLIGTNISGTSVSAANFIAGNGTVSTPAYRFIDSDTGLYSTGSNIRFTTDGTERVYIDNNNVVSNLQILAPQGSSSSPSYSYQLDQDTGWFRRASGQTAYMADGVNTLRIGGTQLAVLNGTASVPAYSYIGDENTGMWRSNSDELSLSTNGTQRVILSTSRLTSNLPATINNGADKTLITSNSVGNGRLQISETQVGNKNPGIEFLDGTTFKGGYFYNNASTERMEHWGPSNRYLYYTESTGYLQTEKPFLSSNRITWGTVPLGYGNIEVNNTTSGQGASIYLSNTNVTSGDNAYTVIRFSAAASSIGNAALHRFNDQHNNGAFRRNAFNMHAISSPSVVTISNDDGTNGIEFYSGGVSLTERRLSITSTAITAELGIRLPDGGITTPSLSFSNDINLGLYRNGTDSMRVVCDGDSSFQFTRTANTTYAQLYLPDGLAAGPAISWTTDTNTGLFSPTGDAIGITTGGTERARFREDALLIGYTAPVSGSYKNKLEVNGDTFFKTTKGQLAWTSNETTTITTNNTYVQIVGSDVQTTDGSMSSTSAKLTCSATGTYLCYYSMTFYATVGFITKIAVFVGGTIVSESVTEEFHASVAGSTAPRTLSKQFFYLQASDTGVDIDIRCTCSDGATQNIVVTTGTFGLFKI